MKGINPNLPFRGKGGAFVYSVQDGKQVARAYQDKIFNPRTEGQLEQRSKINLAGQFSGKIPAEAIAGLQKGSKRKNRSAFMSALLNAINVNTANGYTASFAASDVVFSRGNAPRLFTADISQMATDQKTCIVAVGAPVGVTADEIAKSALRYVLVGINPETSRADYAVTGFLTLPEAPTSTATSATTTIRLIPADAEVLTTYRMLLYVIPIKHDESNPSGVLSEAMGYEGTGLDTSVVASLEARGVTTSLMYGDSYLAAGANPSNPT